MDAAAVVLVEGVSDKAALEALALRLGRALDAEGITVVPIGGASGFDRYLQDLARDPEFRGTVAGLCDEGEADDVRRGLERAGFGTDLSRAEMEALGFYVCVADLEDELIRALGPTAVERIVDREGELRSFRTFQRQPEWRQRPVADQLRRFIGVKSGRKARYGSLLVEALDLDRIPRPLLGVFSHV